MIINRKIRRTMQESKSQYFGSVVLIIISCMLFTMLNLLSGNMNEMTAAFEKDYVQEDASFTTGSRLNNIEEIETQLNARIEEGMGFDYSIAKNKTLRVFSENEKVNIPAIIEGKALSGSDILIDPYFAKANNMKIGDLVKLYDKSFKIGGFMSLPNYIYPIRSENDIINDPKSFGIAVISKSDFSRLGKGNSFYAIKFNGTLSSIDAGTEARSYLESRNVAVNQWTDISDNKRVIYVNAKIQGISKMSTSVPIIILMLTCILTGIVIWRMLERESVIIGTLYAQGYRRKEIMKHYMSYPLIVALTGGIIGTALGALLLRTMLHVMLSYFNIPAHSLNYNLSVMVLSLLLPIILLSISGYFVLSRELRYSPVELMRGGRQKNKVNFIERRLTLERLSFPMKFKIREQLRSLSRLAFLLAGVVLATMLLLYGFTAKSSMDYFMKDMLQNSFKFQYEYVYNALHQEQPPTGTEAFGASAFVLKSDNKTDLKAVGINPDTQFISLKDKKGNELDKNQVIITKPLATKLKVVPGDTIDVKSKFGSKNYSITISSVAETYIGEYVFMPLAQLNDMLGYTAGSYAGLWSRVKLDIPQKSLYSTQTISDSVNALKASIQPLQVTIGIISFMSFIIGLIVIYVVTSLIIEENKGNISLMKVFGYRRKEISALILNSSTMVIIIGYIIGIPLIMASMDALFKSLAESVKMTLPIKISYPYIVLGFAVLYLTFLLSKALSRKKVDRISMSEALKSGME